MLKGKKIFKSIINFLKSCYLSSVFEKKASRIFSFFKSAFEKSIIMSFLRDFPHKEAFQKSVVGRVFALLLNIKISSKAEERLAKLKEKSTLYSLFTSKNKGYIRIFVFLLLLLVVGILYGLLGISGAALGFLSGCAIILLFIYPVLGVFAFVGLSAILPTMALAGIIAFSFVAFLTKLILNREKTYKFSAFSPWIFIFFILTLVATLFGEARSQGIKILAIYVIFLLGYGLITNLIDTKEKWKALVLFFVLCSSFVALYGIYQNFFLTSTTQSWVDEEMFSDIKTRVYATLDNPNVLGQYFIMIMPIAFSLIFSVRKNLGKILYTIINILMFLCLVYTWSRGAWLGVVIGLLFFVLIKDRRWLIFCVAGLLIMPSVLPDSILNRLLSIGNINDSSTAYRVAVWIGSVRLIKDYWLLGIGIGSDAFLNVYPAYALGGADFALHSHNFYLQWIVDVGILGLFVYAGFILTAIFEIGKVGKKDKFIKNVSIAMIGGIFGYLFHGMAENLWYNYRMILVFFAYLGILESAKMMTEDDKEEGI